MRYLDMLNCNNILEPKNTKEDINKFERQNEKYVMTILQWDKVTNKKKLPVTLIRSLSEKKASGKTIVMLLSYHWMMISTLFAHYKHRQAGYCPCLLKQI